MDFVLHVSLLVELGFGIQLETCVALPWPRAFSLKSFTLFLGRHQAAICGVDTRSPSSASLAGKEALLWKRGTFFGRANVRVLAR